MILIPGWLPPSPISREGTPNRPGASLDIACRPPVRAVAPPNEGPGGPPTPRLYISVIVGMEEVLPLEKLSVPLHLPAKTPFSPLLLISEKLMTDWWPALDLQMWCCFFRKLHFERVQVVENQLNYLTWQWVLVWRSEEKLVHCTGIVENNGIITIITSLCLKMGDTLAVIYKQLPESNLPCVCEALVREHTAVQLARWCNLLSDSMWLPVATMHSNTCCKYLQVVLQSSRTRLRHTGCIMLVYAQHQNCLAKWKIIRSSECAPKSNNSYTSNLTASYASVFLHFNPHRNCISKKYSILVMILSARQTWIWLYWGAKWSQWTQRPPSSLENSLSHNFLTASGF